MEAIESMTEIQTRVDSQTRDLILVDQMKRSKKNLDTDYVQPPEQPFAKVDAPKRSSRVPSFLTIHEAEIRQLQKLKLGPTAIAKRICANNGLAEGAITGKQISNWLNYQKKARGRKTNPVSLKNANLAVNSSDSKCMLQYSFRLLLKIRVFRCRTTR
jgi:hypothetical protein